LFIFKGNFKIGNSKCERSRHLFHNCLLLESLPDISNWDTKNVIDINGMFYGCESLKKLPDISKWNTSNIKDMSYLFYGCNKLESLPNIGKWETSNVYNMPGIFGCCHNIVYFLIFLNGLLRSINYLM